MGKRRRDDACKIKKHISLTPDARDRIQDWARAQGISFSAAIEGLALAGMADGQMEGLLLLLKATVSQVVMGNLNRFAKLIAYAGLEAGTARHAAQSAVFLQMVTLAAGVQEAGQLADRYAVDLETPLGAEIARLFQEREARYRWQAVQGLKRPLAELHELLDEWQADAPGLEEEE